LNRLDARVDPAELIDERHDHKQTRAFDLPKLAEAEDDRTLPFGSEPDGTGGNEVHDKPADREGDEGWWGLDSHPDGDECTDAGEHDEDQWGDVVNHDPACNRRR
jgi:hypothetical protein